MTIRDRVKSLVRVRAGDLLPNPKNWRRHPRAQADALRGILAEVGFADALLARETAAGLMLIDGHLRAETTPDMEVPVLILDLNEAESDKLLLVLDPLAAMAEADKASVNALLATVHTDSQAVASLLARIAAGEAAWQGHNDPTEVAEIPAQVDMAAELQAKWGTAAGQAWQIGPHRLVCGDCRDEGTAGRLWRDGRPKLRMVWTDPPYGVDYAAKNAFLNRSDRGNRIQAPIENDKLTAGETGIMFKQALAVARQFAEPGAACYATVPSGPLLFYFFQAFTAAGFTFHAQLTWVKHHFVIGMADYHHRYEPILYGWLPDAAHYFVDDRSQDDVFEVDKPHVSKWHPTTKPVELVARMVANSSRRGETVYDPFCGSGTTLVACDQLGRTGYGVEIDPGYVAVAIQRLADLGLEPKIVDG
jgi:DNA modification methylase